MTRQGNPFNLGDRAIEALDWMFSLDATGLGVQVPVRSLQAQFQLSRTETEDVVGELESKGLVNILTPISGAELQLTHRVASALVERLQFDTLADVRAVAEEIAKAGNSVTGPEIQGATGLSPFRINLAASYLRAEGLVDSRNSLGQSDYAFTELLATYQTRRFLGSAK